MSWLVVSALLLLNAPQPRHEVANRLVPEETRRQLARVQGSHPLGEPGSPALLETFDREVQSLGVDRSYRRTITFADHAATPRPAPAWKTARYGVVSYGLTREGPLGKGVQVWVDLNDSSYVVVPKSVIRDADILLVRGGYDITDYYRVGTRVGRHFEISYRPGPDPLPQTGPGEEWVQPADGEITIRVEIRSRRPLPQLFHGDGTVERVTR